MATRGLKESNSFKKYRRGPWQEHFCGISSKPSKLVSEKMFKIKIFDPDLDKMTLTPQKTLKTENKHI